MVHEPTPALSILNSHPSLLPGPSLLHELIHHSESAAEIAIDFLEDGSRREISYRELHTLSDALAKRITCTLARLENASPVVPVLLPQCPDLYVALLAILKAGKAFCPIGLDTPDERLQFILEDLSATVVITSSAHQSDVIQNLNVHPILVQPEPMEAHSQLHATLPDVKASDTAYVLYTSGSTGTPKAVGVSHGAVTQSLLAHDRHIPDFNRFLQFAAPTFDVSIFEIFFPLYRAKTMVGSTRQQMLNDLPSVMREMQVDAAELTPTVASNLLRERQSVPGLKLLLTIGEMLTRHVVDEFGGDVEKESILWGMYGPTEAAIHCTLQSSFQCNSTVGNIGIPLDTVSAFIMEPVHEGSVPTTTIVPFGEIGELVVGGYQVAEGYLNRPDLTSAAFIEHSEFGKLYRTGDKARLLPDGKLECLGRIAAGQVKLRGMRVELGEVEQAILKVKDCRMAAALGIDGSLVAFCSSGDRPNTRQIIMETCQRWLPSYMVPADIILLSRMPQLPSGKIDKKTLESIYLERKPEQLPTPPPDSPIHQVLQEVLDREVPFGVPLNTLGLDSLRSIKISSMLRRKGYEVGAVEILSAANLEGLIAKCEANQCGQKVDTTSDFDTLKEAALGSTALEQHRDLISDIIPCTPLQEAMLAETMLRSDAYCNWVELELSRPQSFEELRTQIERLAADNEILRSGFLAISATKTSSFAQVIWSGLHKSQIMEVSHFSRKHSLGSIESMLRPLTVQINTSHESPRILLQIHHALYDGWSLDLLLNDLRGLLDETTPPSRPQYSEVVRFYDQLRLGNDLSASAEYWSDVLKDYYPTPLPNFNGKIVEANLLQSMARVSVVGMEGLEDRATQLSINPQVFFQAALSYILGLYLGSPDVVVGAVTSGRTIPVTGIEQILGPCIASLPMRVDITGCATVLDLLQTVQKANRDMLEHCTLPLRDIVKLSGLHRGTLLFDVLFVWQQSLFSDGQNSSVKIVDQADELEYNLTIEFEPLEDRLLSKATYNPAVIPESQVQRLLCQMDNIVTYFLQDVQQPIDNALQCFDIENISIANPAPTSCSTDYGPAYTVERWASQEPERQALIFGTRKSGILAAEATLTYAKLNERANQLAHCLSYQNIGDDELVGVIMEKSANLYISILAVTKLGCGYLPIVPDSPPERTSRILADAGVTVCISESSSSEQIRGKVSCKIMDFDGLDLSRYSTENLNIAYNPDHLAYAVFTSGSTGTPKGVLVTQGNLMSNLNYLYGLYPTSDRSRLLQACSQAFDVSVFEIFFTWYAGMCLCTAKKDDLFSDFEQSINSLGITHLSLTPTVAALVNPSHVSTVEFLVTAGEALTEHVRRQWAGKGLWQGYGPSETTNICTVRGPFTREDLINNIGPPFDNTSAFVMEPDTETILPQGAIGELCFGGSQVFRGYLNMPELNARKIIRHPKYGRIYRSGDMGMLLPDHSIMFARRADDQVKIRGQRVELGEITSNIIDDPAVEDCATLLFNLDNTGQRLVAFWVPKDAENDKFEVLDIREFSASIQSIFGVLTAKLPSYMVPTHLIPITRLPLTAQSKIDKRHLFSNYESLSIQYLERAAHRADTNDGHDTFSEKEREIAKVLAEMMEMSFNDISRTSSFFSLGLDSISAIRFSKRLRDAGIADVSVSVILKNSTVARLAASCARATTKDASSKSSTLTVSEIVPSELRNDIISLFAARNIQVQKILPCTPLQEAMLSSTSVEKDLSYYNTLVFTINGNAQRLQDCWAEMFKRHDILRTAFVPTDNSSFAFVQVILPYEELECAELRPDQTALEFVSESLSGLLEAFKPPVRLAYRQPNGCKQLVFCCHHALYDGGAVTTLLQEIEQIYLGNSLLPPVPYERYLQHAVSQDLGAADRFWRSKLANLEPTLFPKLSGSTRRQKSFGSQSVRTLQVSGSVVTQFCQKASVSLLSVVQAAWAKLLHFYTNEEDLCFGNVVSGRTLPEEGLERLVAPCFNTLPVRLNFEFTKSNEDMVRDLHDFNIDSLPYQLTPLRRVQTRMRKENGRLFDSLVILQQSNQPLNDSIWRLNEDLGAMDLPVVCEISPDEQSDTLRLTLHYHESLLSSKDARLVAETFDYSLQSLVQFPRSPARDTIGFPADVLSLSNLHFEVLDEAEDSLLHSAFERNSTLLPDHPALDFQHADGRKTTWSFGDLNKLANQIAHALLAQGVKPEDIVPVHIAKSPGFYASILGVLKAGAAFTPFHPELPEARKQFMLSELQPKVMLCSDTESLLWAGNVVIVDIHTTTTCPTENPSISGLRSTSLVYCLYTSGSTGVPKAVCMEHRAPLQTVASSKERIPWQPDSRLLQYAATTFDMCYYDCFLAWSYGITLCASEQATMLNDLPSVIRSLNVDLLDLTPSIAASLKKADVPCVRWLYCIGEAMSADVVREWGGACVNSYGPTEAAFCTTIYPSDGSRSVNIIGKPFPTTSFAVFPKSGERLLPVFGVGELYIGGAQLARGYYQKPELNAERFVMRNGQRFYKSGDTVRLLGDGNFEFIGRADDQVKIRGLRVELGEINHVVQACDERLQTVTTQILKKDASSRPQLVTFLEIGKNTLEEEQRELEKKTKAAALRNLPAYMVPKFYFFLDKIPKSAAGKIDKNILSKIFRQSGSCISISEEDSATHQWTESELRIRESFAKISATPIENVLPTTSIYQLGLDSISAVQVAARLRKGGLEVTVTDVLKYMNCVDLGAHIDQSPTRDVPATVVFDFDAFDNRFRADVCEAYKIAEDHVEAVRPCTPLQSGMISQFLAKDGAVYLNYLNLRLSPDIVLSKLKEAWRSVMVRHPMLRTGFVDVKDRKHSFAMVHYSPTACILPCEDILEANSAGSWLAQVERSAFERLHLPPWRIRISHDRSDISLELAIFHALYDAQSLRVILEDVARAYGQTSLEPPIPLEPVIGTILDLSSIERSSSKLFWTRLGRSVSPSRFPNLSPLRYESVPPVVVSSLCEIPLSELETGCRRSNITLQAAGIAGWASILSAYSGEPSVTCGIVISGRNFDAAESAVFPCITTIPLTCAVSDDRPAMLKNIMTFNAEVQQHQFTPLNEVQRLMGYPKEPLFDTIFTFQKLQNGPTKQELWTIVDEKATIEYPISIELEPKGDKLELRLTFLPHMVPEAHAALILSQLEHLIASFIFSDRGKLEMFDSRLYSITSPKEPTLPSEVRLLHEFVEASALRHPERIALEFATSIGDISYESRQWTYAQFNIEGNKIANFLRSHGARPGSLIGVCFDKCPEAYFAILGILKAGCAFVALDPGAPVARRAFIVEDSGADLILSMKAQSSGLAEIIEATILNMDEIDLRSVSGTTPFLEQPIDPQGLSYCLYTSGTTGTPKGCEITHENAVQAMLSFRRLFSGHWNEESRWLQFASFHFDVSVLEQYWSWFVGIRLVSAPRDVIFEDLARTIRLLDITHIDLTPSLARIVHPDEVPSLCRGVFITGGESLKQEILDVWGPKNVIYNGYGPTEATIGCTMYPRVPANGKPSNIGPAFDNVGSFVLRPGTDIPVLRGGVGELCVSGKLVGKGYLNRQQLTEERFPYLERFKERVYRTGDLVRILHNGTFDFLGRADDQVKLRGQRLEIGEINSVIKQAAAGISDVATLVVKHPKQPKEQLVSFLVTGTKAQGEPMVLHEITNDIEAAREACRDRLPPYMVPTHFIPLSAMPLSANNKAENRRLKELYNTLSTSELQSLSGPANGFEGEWSTDEQKIRQVLQEKLRIDVDDIKKRSSIFELGLDSVSVISFSRSLKQAGFSRATASLIMNNTSVDRLSRALTGHGSTYNDRGSILAAQQAVSAVQHRHRRDVAEALGVPLADIETLAPCTPLQQGIIARSLGSEEGLYFNDFHFTVAEGVDDRKLKAAWETAFTLIPILRTAFINTEDGYVQVVQRNPSFPWTSHSLSTGETFSEHLQRLKKQWIDSNRPVYKKPFELHLIASPKRMTLAVNIFHGLYDGISINLLFKAVWHLFNDGQKVDIGPSFHSILSHGPLRPVTGAQDFWKAHLSNLKTGRLSLSPGVSKSESIILTRDIADMARYECVRRKLNVTPQAIAQACWTTVLHNFHNGPVTLGMVVSGRSIDFENAERVIGPMFNTLPYQHQLRAKESWASIIKKMHEFNVSSLPYQHTPLRDIMKWLNRSPSQPLFDTLFVYQVVDQEHEGVNNAAWKLKNGDAEADYPLAFEVEQKGDGSLKVTLVAQNEALNEATSRQLLDSFEKSLETALEDPDVMVEWESTNGDDATQHTSSSASTGSFDDADTFEWTPTATTIRHELASLAGSEESNIDEKTSIFELGLDSIDAIKLSSKLKRHGISLPVSRIMRSLTVANMAKVSTGDSQGAVQPTNTIYTSLQGKLEEYVQRSGVLVEDIERILPLTGLQEGMVAEMIASDYTRYYNHDILELATDVDLDKLQEAWMTVVTSSPILRTSFIGVDDPAIDASFAQIIHRTARDFLSCTKTDDEPDFPQYFEDMRKRATDASRPGPLFHIHILDRPCQRYLVLSIAHALYDGWSLGLLHADVHAAYKSRFRARPEYEPALREILTSSGADAESYWKDFLAHACPTSFRRRPKINGQISQRTHRLERASCMDLADLTSFARKNHITLQALGQTVYVLALASYARSLDVTFGSVLSGRDNENMSQIMFPTMNTVAVRTIVHGTRREMLQYMQGNLLNIKQWQHFPLRKAQALAGVQSQLFESLFIYQRRADVENDDRQKLYESVEGHSDVEYPVCVEVEIFEGKFTWRCAVKEEIFDLSGANGLLSELDALLRAIVEQPDAPTVDFTAAGASICGLPAFKEEQAAKTSQSTEPEIATSAETESSTAKAIRKVLALVSQTPEEEITAGMTIFHMGLDSISAIKVSSLLRKRNILLSVGEMLKAGSVEKMAQIVDGRKMTEEPEVHNPEDMLKEAMAHIDQDAVMQEAGIDLANVEQIRQATAGQVYMLSMWLKSGKTLFYPAFSYKAEGDITFSRLQQAWQILVAANPILSTVLVGTKDARLPYVQATVVRAEASVTDITGRDEKTVSKMIDEHASRQPFAHLFVSKAPSGWYLKLKIHHALYDGVSLPLLMQQFQNACNNAELPSISKDDFSSFIARCASSCALDARRAFWTNYLQDISLERLTQPSTPPESKTEIFKPALIQNMGPFENLAGTHGIPTQCFFMAAYAKFYAAVVSTPDEKDVVIGIYLANRSHNIPELAEAAVPTVNLIPLRVSKPLQNDLLSMARQIHQDVQEISDPANSGVSLFEIKEWTDVVVDTFVNFLKLPDSDSEDHTQRGSADVAVMQTGEWEGEVGRVTGVEFPSPGSGDGASLVDDAVNSAYMHAVDIEATIRNGALDVGVFAPNEMLGLQDARRLVEDLKREMEGLLQGVA